MYIPSSFRVDDQDELARFMRANSFATLVSSLDGGMVASHVPLVLELREGRAVLIGHLARQNEQCRALGEGEHLAIFSGPHAYISPTLYEKAESVPTWNYIAVHAYGRARALTLAEDGERLRGMVERMIATYEASYQAQWEGLSERYREGMLKGIVGFELEVTRLEGKYKLSQNRSAADQQSVAHALAARPDQAEAATGHAMLEIQGRA